MNTTRFESLTKEMATSTTRRRALAGLGALALGGAGVLGRSRVTAAQVSAEDARRRCIERCIERGGSNHLRRRRERCRRRCENR